MDIIKYILSLFQKSNPIKTSPPKTLIRKVQPIAPVITKSSVAVFDPNYIISDKEFTDCNSMNENQIQEFIASKGSFLKDYTVNGALPSHWVYTYCNDYGLNPKVLLTNMQKENGLISQSTIPTRQKSLQYGLGVGCYNNPLRFDPKWAGFDNQIKGSVLTCTNRFKASTILKYPLSYTTDRPEFKKLLIKNAATKTLYEYTPFSGDKTMVIDGSKYANPFGNALFFYIYNKWFSSMT